jgi:hypothetical protein
VGLCRIEEEDSAAAFSSTGDYQALKMTAVGTTLRTEEKRQSRKRFLAISPDDASAATTTHTTADSTRRST